MTFTRYILWIAFTIVSSGVVSVLQYPIRKRCGYPVRIVIMIGKAAATTAIAYVIMATNTWIAWKGGFFLATFYAALIGDVIADVLTVPYVIKKKARDCQKVQTFASIICIFLFFLYGTINMQVVHANRFTVESEKLHSDYKFVFLADLHVGSTQSMETIRRTIERINAESPDFVLLGGDITDEYTSKEEMKLVYELFGNIDVPIYYIFGNHDRQPNYTIVGARTYADIDLEESLRKNHIQVLEDEWVQVADDLVLMGRDDVSTGIDRIDLAEIPERPDDAFVILLDHSPYTVDDTIVSGADFQLSGHTHAGQLFPLKFLYNCTDHDAYGFYKHGDTQVYVSAGASGWSFPFRTEASCQYDVITLKEKSIKR